MFLFARAIQPLNWPATGIGPFVFGIVLAGSASFAQTEQPSEVIQTQRWSFNSEPQDGLPLLIETSPPIANLLMRAEDGVDRRDWKLAIDSLQRVIDDRSGTLVPREDGAHDEGMLFESARRRALRRLASLPAEGMLAYRVLYDGKAKGLFDRAKAASDAGAMQAVADRFLLTRYGDDAADWAASWALDAGRFVDAVSRLKDLVDFVPDNDVPPERIYGKLFAAYSLLGRPVDAQIALDELRERIGRSSGDASAEAKLIASLNPHWVTQMQERLVHAELAKDSLPRSMGPKLRPTLSGPVPWGYELTGTAADLWRRIADFQPGDPAPIPRVDLAAANQQVFVRIPGGCVALDMEDLSLMWQAVSATLPRPSQIPDPRRLNLQNATVRISGPYTEDPTNKISTAAGLVFTIDRHGMGEFLGKDEVQVGGVMFIRPNARLVRNVDGTRLTAYDAQSGDIRWRRGRTDDSADVLGNVRFLSPPIAVQDQLWVPYARGMDLFVGALRPDDGALMRQTLIGSVRDSTPARDPVQAVEPVASMTLAEETVYVPTGLGAIAAIEVAGMKPKWNYAYDKFAAGRRRIGMQTHWIASAPLVSSGVVLVAAPDLEDVIGLDAATGVYRWSGQATGCTYPIATNRGMVWLGGRRIVCLNMADGKELWNAELTGTPTGKAALCGDQIQVPVSTGLITFDAQSGTILGHQDLPISQAPLGNIACVGASLYSLEPSSVRKFADLELLHQQASQEIASGSPSVAPHIRLAWAELLQGRARAAYEAVAGILPEQTSGIRQRMSLARVRIESLLALAQQTDSPEQSLKLLESAGTENLTPQLRLRFQMAIANQLSALGRVQEAYQRLLTLALDTDATVLGPLREGVRVATRLEIKAMLDGLLARMDSAAKSKLLKDAEELVHQLASSQGQGSTESAKLLAIAQIHEGTQLEQAALIALADRQIRQREYETAEQTLLECMRGTPDSESALEANIRLLAMYLESDQSGAGLVAHARETLAARLERLAGTGSGAANRGKSDSLIEEARELILKSGVLLSDERQKMALGTMYSQPGTEPAGMALSGRVAWTYEPPIEGEPTRVVRFGDKLPRALADRVIMLGRDGFLECLSAERKETLWRARMVLPGAFDEITESSTRSQSVARFGVMDGQTMVLNGPDGVFGVGALTGRLLWAKGFDRAIQDLTGSAARDRIMAAGDGQVVAAPRDGFLSMMRIADGSPIWERDLRGESVARVWLEKEAVVFADADMKRVHLLGREDGRLIAQILLRQPDPEHERVTLVLSDGLLYGPGRTETTEAVVAFELATGRQAWKVDVDKPIVSLFEPSSGYLGVGLLGGDVKILRASSGEILLERSDPSVRAVTAGAMWAGTLILRSTALRGPRQAIEVAAYDIATGTEVWRRKDVAVLSTGDDGLEVVSGMIPAIIEKARTEDVVKHPSGTRLLAMATLINVRTGTDSGMATEIAGSGQGYSVNGDLALWPGILTVGSMKGVQAMRVELTAMPERGF